MAYEGETIRIVATVTDFDGNVLTDTDVTSAQVNLYDGSGNYVFQNQDLTWDTTQTYWYYDWQNSLTGNWIAQCIFIGSVFEVYNYVNVKVRAPKITPTGQPAP